MGCAVQSSPLVWVVLMCLPVPAPIPRVGIADTWHHTANFTCLGCKKLDEIVLWRLIDEHK